MVTEVFGFGLDGGQGTRASAGQVVALISSAHTDSLHFMSSNVKKYFINMFD